jgi:hypothetical protein
MNLYHDKRKQITVIGKNDNLSSSSQNVNKELFLFGKGRSPLNADKKTRSGQI